MIELERTDVAEKMSNEQKVKRVSIQRFDDVVSQLCCTLAESTAEIPKTLLADLIYLKQVYFDPRMTPQQREVIVWLVKRLVAHFTHQTLQEPLYQCALTLELSSELWKISQRSLSSHSKWTERHALAGLLTEKTQKNAVERLQQLAQQELLSAVGYLSLAKFYLNQQQPAQVLALLASQPASWQVQMLMGRAYRQQQQPDLAKRYWQTASSDVPAQLTVDLINDALMLLSGLASLKDHGRVLTLSQKILATQKYTLSQLADVTNALIRAHAYEQAEPWVEQLLKQDSTRKMHWEHQRSTVRVMRTVPTELRPIRAAAGLYAVLSELPQPCQVLDVGSGGGEHADVFEAAGHHVTCVDFGRSVYYQQRQEALAKRQIIYADYMQMQLPQQYDVVWASHVLEHQPDSGAFIQRLMQDCKPNGWLAISVPPLKHEIVGGHLTLWNAGLLLYQLAFAGINCRDAKVMTYGYNISVVVQNRPIERPALDYDAGDVDRLAAFLPEGFVEHTDGRLLAERFLPPPQ
ncbi:MAG: class I SAM-dependent methyltransferase [Pseudomonadota bacterium]|nr:class I SAM-dependent methyltransferase [Pseudomonadota bacterium]